MRFRAYIFFLLFATALFAQAPKPAPKQAEKEKDPPTINVEVKLVNVFTTVTDQRGAPVASLKKEDFTLLENDEPQTISVFDRESELPLSIVLAIDTSLSTKKDLGLELASARQFVHTILRPVDSLTIFTFSQFVDQISPFTHDLHRIDAALSGVRAGAGTAVFDAVALGADELANRQGRKVMVMVTDGEDNFSKMDYAGALRAAQESDAIIYSVIIVPIEADAGRSTGGEHALIQLSNDTGGKYFYAGSTAQLERAFQRISEELRTQYLLAYYPKRRLSDHPFRTIEVQVAGAGGRKYQVRHRAGYYTARAK